MRSPYVPIVVLIIAITAILCVPLAILGSGFLPPDDALRHAGKAVSGKPWSEILVLRNPAEIDVHKGWNDILTVIHRATGADTDALVTISIFSLFVLFCVSALIFLRRPEALGLTFLVMTATGVSLITRLLMGRPYIITMAALIVILSVWKRLDKKIPSLAACAAIIGCTAFAAWTHGGWYLFSLPILCIFLARRWRAGTIIAGCTAIGLIIGIALTGNPLGYLRGIIDNAATFFSMQQTLNQKLLPTEFQSFKGDAVFLLTLISFIIWRAVAKKRPLGLAQDPAFILAFIGWVLAFRVQRFWYDVSMPALVVWMSRQFQEHLEEHTDIFSAKRIIIAVVTFGAFFLALTADVNNRWTENLSIEYLTPEDPKIAKWLPEPGGIIYSESMGIFYQTFYKNPHAPWRYMVGFAPVMMPDGDRKIFEKIVWNDAAFESYLPWVKKMRTQDRLILHRDSSPASGIPGLEWRYAATGIWIGRLPR